MRKPISKEMIEELYKKYHGKCLLCGKSKILLQLHHKVPLSEGGTSTIDNLVLLCVNCHALMNLKEKPKEIEFIQYMMSLLENNENYRNVIAQVRLGPRYIIDLVAEEKVKNKWRKIYVECKSYGAIGHKRANNIFFQLEKFKNYIKKGALILAFPGQLSESILHEYADVGVEIWDLKYISKSFQKQIENNDNDYYKLLFSLEKPKEEETLEQTLIDNLHKTSCGKEKWNYYQRLVGDILECLFYPPLSRPISELSDYYKVNRRDFIIPNYADQGFWRYLRERYLADYIVVDAKNYCQTIRKREVLQISNYLKQHGVGLFGMIFSRKGSSKSAILTQREIWGIQGKLIIILDDQDVEQMLLAKLNDNIPDEVLKQKIEDFRLSI